MTKVSIVLGGMRALARCNGRGVDDPCVARWLAAVNAEMGFDIFPVASAGNGVLEYAISETTKPYGKRKPAKKMVEELQSAVETMHAWADDARLAVEARNFFKSMALPQPDAVPDAYRTGREHLHVLWGWSENGADGFLPLSERARKWNDAQGRVNVADVVKTGIGGAVAAVLRKVALWLAGVGAIAGAAAYVVFAMPARCEVHGTDTGRGLAAFLQRHERCEMRCGGEGGCGRHLERDGKCGNEECPKKKMYCKECGARMDEVTGLCSMACKECGWHLAEGGACRNRNCPKAKIPCKECGKILEGREVKWNDGLCEKCFRQPKGRGW
ncbi:MAG: hypothetical protein IJ802_05130 [Kiritimatiellae bacterium]|nr:hypothetical protein [Kiritimatiellia bacterium]